MTNEIIQYSIIAVVFIAAVIFLYRKMKGSSKGGCGCSKGACCNVNESTKQR
ncbi:hypothetical protein ACR79B_13410 [Sphingobacterium spiritivorum]|uniref:hypothetical protein n=1 Tax=Sphingobacterium spiritivorum TaxID=258 RepID=UPI003DA25954